MDKKKKTKGSKKKRKTKGALMSDKEAILVYKLSVAEEKLHEAKQEAQAWKEKNERHIKRNHKLHSEQTVLVERLLNQFRETETKWNSEEVVGKDVVVEALQDKWNRVEDQKKVIAATLTDQLVHERDRVEGTMTEKVESQKEKANKKVVSLMPKHCCRQLKDNGWLKREIELHVKEHEELSQCVSELEKSNLEKMKHLFEINANDLRISRTAILNQCSENDDMEASPSAIEIDLANIINTWSKRVDINTKSIVPVADYSRPPSSFFLTQDEQSHKTNNFEEGLLVGNIDFYLFIGSPFIDARGMKIQFNRCGS
ncbi:coiled-coil domain-containing protein 83-like [Octopus bimaculoides]|uniref:coiled-coil domain-containing protein 83-like n=1 Tax=Octopus bimaculoides TaxID=37653 RepID=UPI0022E4C228|nr:coiled-coil domain-containing protein 83-like [Octopus bimaculoides]